jgi:hypothetical protein
MNDNQLTKEKVYFPALKCSGHLYQVWYQDGNIAIVAGYRGRIGKFSVNLTNRLDELKENEFFVKLYSEGKMINDPCFETGLFEKAGKPFKNYKNDFIDVKYQKWRLKK